MNCHQYTVSIIPLSRDVKGTEEQTNDPCTSTYNLHHSQDARYFDHCANVYMYYIDTLPIDNIICITMLYSVRRNEATL